MPPQPISTRLPPSITYRGFCNVSNFVCKLPLLSLGEGVFWYKSGGHILVIISSFNVQLCRLNLFSNFLNTNIHFEDCTLYNLRLTTCGSTYLYRDSVVVFILFYFQAFATEHCAFTNLGPTKCGSTSLQIDSMLVFI